jgi:hypothetical protein
MICAKKVVTQSAVCFGEFVVLYLTMSSPGPSTLKATSWHSDLIITPPSTQKSWAKFLPIPVVILISLVFELSTSTASEIHTHHPR